MVGEDVAGKERDLGARAIGIGQARGGVGRQHDQTGRNPAARHAFRDPRAKAGMETVRYEQCGHAQEFVGRKPANFSILRAIC